MRSFTHLLDTTDNSVSRILAIHIHIYIIF